MSGTTISSYGTVGVQLTAVSQNPVTVTSTGTIDTATGNAIYGSNADAWTISSTGTIRSTAPGQNGVFLKQGGTVTNGASGATGALISGAFSGVTIGRASGAVINYGTIMNTGSSGLAIDLAHGGSIVNGATNATGALMSGAVDAVAISGAPGTVANYGTLGGTATEGVFLFNRLRKFAEILSV